MAATCRSTDYSQNTSVGPNPGINGQWHAWGTQERTSYESQTDAMLKPHPMIIRCHVLKFLVRNSLKAGRM